MVAFRVSGIPVGHPQPRRGLRKSRGAQGCVSEWGSTVEDDMLLMTVGSDGAAVAQHRHCRLEANLDKYTATPVLSGRATTRARARAKRRDAGHLCSSFARTGWNRRERWRKCTQQLKRAVFVQNELQARRNDEDEKQCRELQQDEDGTRPDGKDLSPQVEDHPFRDHGADVERSESVPASNGAKNLELWSY